MNTLQQASDNSNNQNDESQTIKRLQDQIKANNENIENKDAKIKKLEEDLKAFQIQIDKLKHNEVEYEKLKNQNTQLNELIQLLLVDGNPEIKMKQNEILDKFKNNNSLNNYKCCENKIVKCRKYNCFYHQKCIIQRCLERKQSISHVFCECENQTNFKNFDKKLLSGEQIVKLEQTFENQISIIKTNQSSKQLWHIYVCPTPAFLILSELLCFGSWRVSDLYNNIIEKKMNINEIYPDQSIPPPSQSIFDQPCSPKVNQDLAQDHRLATKVGKPKNKGRVCQCCGFQIEREDLNLCIGADQLGFLGSGYPMYFDFIKSCLVIISIQYISVGNFLLITHVGSLFQLSQTEQSLQEKQDVLSLTAIYFTMIYIIYFRHNQMKLDSFCDLKQTTPGDYSVLLSGLPSQSAREELEIKIKEEFENVVKVCFIYKQIINNQDNSRLFLEQLQDTYFEQNYFSGSALVSFKYKENKLKFLKKAKYNILKYYIKQFLHLDLNTDGQVYFQGHLLQVRQAPEPTDINWKYLNEWIEQGNYKKFFEIVLNFSLLVLLLYVTCTTKQTINKIITIKSLFTPLITIISYYLIPFLTKFINFRKYLSWTQTQNSWAYKMTILMSLFTIFISQFFNGEMFLIFLSNTFLPPIFLIIRPRQLLKNFKIKFRPLPQDQKELNQLYEYQNHNLTRNHAFINYTMIITNIYGTLMPINSIIAATGLILYYWTDKYVLLRYSTVRNQPSSILSLDMYRLISFTPLMISCQHFINQPHDILAKVQLISTLIFYFIPQDLLIKKIWKTKKLKEFAPYDEAQFNFCYDRTNPALQDKATQNWVTLQKSAHAKKKKVLHQLDEEQKEKLNKSLQKQLTKVQKLIGQMEAQLEQKQTTKLITQQEYSSSSHQIDYSDFA